VTSQTVTTTSNYSNIVWDSWVTTGNTVTTNSDITIVTDGTVESPYQTTIWKTWSESAEDSKKAREQRRKDEIKRKREAEKKRKRAEALLKSILTIEEWDDYRLYDSVRVRGQKGIYDIGMGWQGMIYRLDHQGEPMDKLCCHPPGQYPAADRIAAVVLALRADESAVLKEANVHSFYGDEKRRVKARRAHRRVA